MILSKIAKESSCPLEFEVHDLGAQKACLSLCSAFQDHVMACEGS